MAALRTHLDVRWLGNCQSKHICSGSTLYRDKSLCVLTGSVFFIQNVHPHCQGQNLSPVTNLPVGLLSSELTKLLVAGNGWYHCRLVFLKGSNSCVSFKCPLPWKYWVFGWSVDIMCLTLICLCQTVRAFSLVCLFFGGWGGGNLAQ